MNKQQKLEELKKKMASDKTLPLKMGAKNLVFGGGSPDAKVLCVGEGPGYWEDIKGRPFVGNAGAFLNQLLAQAGYKREEVFITNVVHYRPPENRDPEPDEIKAFEPYLDKMINIIEPGVIVTLGRFSMGKFLPNARITQIHGKKFEISWKGKNLMVVPMYHPAAGLRSTQVKEQTMQDFKKLPEILQEAVNEKEESKDKSEQMILI
ncbi:MAG: Phage SPO1 DNA polymerase-related protein [Microgenomates group bacterium GW2011_GWC1_37_8]|uniref:Type-4 uracil-DNA glycosylase n=1 Tax=Candidatus Woesebacteria bacterium GW2011_GWB1_38_8 TaxID=1618570 RepID=A0A0G0LDQ4_9BACT|nr:MAG: Phage SPO1 DNA polymerase-related protein [Microgenomates group bacterium GW2011_GWC1_37_8]KKQ86055.1 MAG: Phage SPO1 DNA polymerase-related protein [Candidatus Woesebacteria bacterium GW2011_GWB1_38_8]